MMIKYGTYMNVTKVKFKLKELLDFNEKDPLESFHRTNQDNMPTHK
jgi:hypothetical protein